MTVSAREYEEFLSSRAKLVEIEEQRRKDQMDSQRREQEALIAKGQIEKALELLRNQSHQEVEEQRRKLTETEGRAKRYALDGELARALAAQPLCSPAAAEQLASLWRGQLTVEAQGDSFVVRTPTFQPVAEFVAQQLQRPEYEHFRRPGSTGGAGGQSPQSAGSASGQAQPKTYATEGERIIDEYNSRQTKEGGDANKNMGLVMGLRKPA